jgi:hypothetical protein
MAERRTSGVTGAWLGQVALAALLLGVGVTGAVGGEGGVGANLVANGDFSQALTARALELPER